MNTLSDNVLMEDITGYLGIDYADEVVTRNLNRALATADALLKGSIGENYPAEDPRIKELALIIIADLYDNRTYTVNNTVTNNVRCLVNDLSLQVKLELSRKTEESEDKSDV